MICNTKTSVGLLIIQMIRVALKCWFFGLTLVAIECLPLNICIAEPPSAAQQFITISESTTYLTSPLTDDGYVDYSAAINEINAVPYQDNAAADLIELAGVPRYWEQTQREKLRQALGLETLPVNGDNLKSPYFLEQDMERAGLPVPSDNERYRQLILTDNHYRGGPAQRETRYCYILPSPPYYSSRQNSNKIG